MPSSLDDFERGLRAGLSIGAKIAAEWKSPLQPGTDARRLGHEEAAREIAAAINKKLEQSRS